MFAELVWSLRHSTCPRILARKTVGLYSVDPTANFRNFSRNLDLMIVYPEAEPLEAVDHLA
jgi:hypothetical protein